MQLLPEEGFWMPPAPPTAMEAASPAPSKAPQGLAPPSKTAPAANGEGEKAAAAWLQWDGWQDQGR